MIDGLDEGPGGCSHIRAGQLWAASVATQKSGPPFCAYGATSLLDFFMSINEERLPKPEMMGLNCNTE